MLNTHTHRRSDGRLDATVLRMDLWFAVFTLWERSKNKIVLSTMAGRHVIPIPQPKTVYRSVGMPAIRTKKKKISKIILLISFFSSLFR